MQAAFCRDFFVEEKDLRNVVIMLLSLYRLYNPSQTRVRFLKNAAVRNAKGRHKSGVFKEFAVRKYNLHNAGLANQRFAITDYYVLRKGRK